MSQSLGLTHEQIHGELYVAWLKDTREPPGMESQKKFRDVIEAGIKEKEVTLRQQRIGVSFSIALASLLSRSSVTKVDLQDNVLRDTGCEAVAHLLREAQNLIHVNMGGNDIGAQGITALSNAVAAHKKLQVLILGSEQPGGHVNRIDAAPAKILLDGVCRSKSLKVLDLSRNPIGRGNQEAFPLIYNLLANSTTIQVLKLAHCNMNTDSGLQVIAGLTKNNSLTYIDLKGNDLSHQVGEALGRVITERAGRTAPNPLKTIILQDNPGMGDRGCSLMFRSLATDKGVSTLNVDNCGVTNDSMLVLCEALAMNATLTQLDLQRNQISRENASEDEVDAVVELARSLMRHPAIQRLSLAHNKVRDDGACALASMLESNTTLTHLDLEDAWIGDRGVVALGVALAGGTALTTLKLSNNHISDDGGAAFAALLDKNRSLQMCSLRGNNMFHNTTARAQRLTSRNKQLKQDEVPSKLRKEVIKLHYQKYKLEEAKNELDNQRMRKGEIDKQQERVESMFREEEQEYRQQKKAINDKIRDQQEQCKNFELQLKALADRMVANEKEHEEEMQQLQERHEAEIAAREDAEQRLKDMHEEIGNAEKNRVERIEKLKQDIEDAKVDRAKWAEQTKMYRSQNEDAQRRASELESSIKAKADTAEAAKAAKEAAKSAKAKEKEKKQADIAALLQSGRGGEPPS